MADYSQIQAKPLEDLAEGKVTLSLTTDAICGGNFFWDKPGDLTIREIHGDARTVDFYSFYMPMLLFPAGLAIKPKIKTIELIIFGLDRLQDKRNTDQSSQRILSEVVYRIETFANELRRLPFTAEVSKSLEDLASGLRERIYPKIGAQAFEVGFVLGKRPAILRDLFLDGGTFLQALDSYTQSLASDFPDTLPGVPMIHERLKWYQIVPKKLYDFIGRIWNKHILTRFALLLFAFLTPYYAAAQAFKTPLDGTVSAALIGAAVLIAVSAKGDTA